MTITDPQTKRTPLHFCAEKGYAELTKFLTETAGADINATDELGWTPLHAACSADFAEIVLYLVRCVCSNVGKFEYRLKNKRIRVLELLL